VFLVVLFWAVIKAAGWKPPIIIYIESERDIVQSETVLFRWPLKFQFVLALASSSSSRSEIPLPRHAE
jgi:hypothetical protein